MFQWPSEWIGKSFSVDPHVDESGVTFGGAMVRRCWVGAALAVVVVFAFSADPIVDGFFRMPGEVWAQSLARFASRWCDFPPMLGLAISFLALASVRRWRVAQRICVAVLLSGVLTGLVGLAVRCLTGRTRPCALVEQGWYGPWHAGHWIVGVHDLNSFPSGHTIFAASMAFVPVFAVGSRARAFGLIPVLVAWSRLCLGKHHLSDVVVALCLGFIGAWVHWNHTLPLLERWSGWWRTLSAGAEIPVAKAGGGGPTERVLCMAAPLGAAPCQTPTE